MGVLETLFGEDARVMRDRDFQVLLFASLSSPLGSTVVSPILATLAVTYGVPETRIGLLMAAYTAPSIVLIPLVGVLSDRFGRRPILLAGLLLLGAAGLGMAFTTNFTHALALRFVQGIGYAGIGPVLITSVGDLYEGAAEATAQGLRFTISGLALTVIPLLAGALVALSWRHPLFLFATAIPVAGIVFFQFEEPTSDDGDSASVLDPLRDLSTVLSERRVVSTMLIRVVPTFIWFCFLTYTSVIVVRLLDGSPAMAGALVALASITSSVVATQVGRLTAAFGSRTLPLLGSIAASGAGLVVLALAPAVPMAALGSALVGSGFGVLLSLVRSEITALAPREARGGLVSVTESIGRIGSTIAPIVVGGGIAATTPLFGDDAIRWTLAGVAVVCVAFGVGCTVVAARSPRPSPAG